MARTLNAATHAVRRDEILDAAERQIRTIGYDAMSVQALQDELGVSRGAIYHYFALEGGDPRRRHRPDDPGRDGKARADRA